MNKDEQVIVPYILNKPPRNWKETMSREEKRFRNRWNTESKPYTPTPKGKIK